ncbi:MAG: cobalt-precorrin 5A hydrolase [Clostridium sp.]|jgi:cobalt-precorrin 5A hydrolase
MTVLISFTGQGRETAERLARGLEGKMGEEAACFDFASQDRQGEEIQRERPQMTVGTLVKEQFERRNNLIFVGAVGIAVRMIAPWIRDKTSDPAVVCVDELGRFAIPVLSGHLGGANRLALCVAGILNAVPVITTATDLHGAFAVDVFAAENGLIIGDMREAKSISAAVLRKEKIGFFSEIPVDGPAPEELTPGIWQRHNICITWKKEGWPEDESRTDISEKAPGGGVSEKKAVLRLFPGGAALGMGCRLGASLETVRQAALLALEEAGMDRRSLTVLATVDRKADEPALCALAREWNLTFLVYTPGELEQAEGEFSESDFVRRTLGVGNVCQRAAALGAARFGDPVIQLTGKTVYEGATAAVAVPDLRQIGRIRWKKTYCM